MTDEIGTGTLRSYHVKSRGKVLYWAQGVNFPKTPTSETQGKALLYRGARPAIAFPASRVAAVIP